MRFLVAVSLAALALVAVACGEPSNAKFPTKNTISEDTALDSGDVIEVRIFYGSKEITRGYRIGSHGKIGVPYIGEVKVAGRPQAEIESEIQQRLSEGYLKDPIVSIYVKEFNSKKIAVFGQVQTPGTLAYFEGMTIVEAISQAGGFTAMAKKNGVTVTRSIDGKKMRYTVPVASIAESGSENFTMRPGDTIFVPERIF